ncbi:MAG: InlB B-repeat-containing protein, partial [Anaerovoracaceae bacterium]
YLINADGSVDSMPSTVVTAGNKYQIKARADAETSFITVSGNTYHVDFGDGTLISKQSINQETSSIRGSIPGEKVTKPLAVIGPDVLLFDAVGRELPNNSDIVLASGEMLSADSINSLVIPVVNTLTDLGLDVNGIRLGLADSKNGNMAVSQETSAAVTVMIPYPAGKTERDTFEIYHFPTPDNPADYLTLLKPEKLLVTKTASGLIVTTNSNLGLLVIGSKTVTYSISYSPGGGVGTLIDSKSPYKDGEKATALGNTFTRKDYNFLNWNTKADGSGTRYLPGALVPMTKDTILFAQWKAVYDEKGFDEDGYDKKGFDKDGFDKDGFDKEGFDKKGYDKKGFDKDGYDKDGYDENGNKKDINTGDYPVDLMVFVIILMNISLGYFVYYWRRKRHN